MIKAGGGVILNQGSCAALVGVPGFAAYSASKAGVVCLTKQMAAEYGKDNIRVNCLCPANTLTGMLPERAAPPDGYLLKFQAIRRVAQPEEIAHAALYLSSDEASFLTGTIMSIDAGYVNTKPAP